MPTPTEFWRQLQALGVQHGIDNPATRMCQIRPVPTPVEFLRQYQALRVQHGIDNPAKQMCQTVTYRVALRKYFMMNWNEGTDQRDDYNLVTRGSRTNQWFQHNKERIRNAAMGKGAPQDYELALEWAVRSKKVNSVTQPVLQNYCDQHLGIDCSGLVTNYLIACNKFAYSAAKVRNTSAASYYNPAKAINDPADVRQGDLLVWMKGNSVLRGPGHVAIVESYVAQTKPEGNMRVVEATGASGANPKVLDSMYSVEQIIDRGSNVPVMILIVKRHGDSGHRVCVIRV
ncbi:hypothetical protein [uncultured Rhodospira sp.]|uniref:hypothetical protein n=1 Tax=uncultured Rhodospira sp. TaxID=1936189 RepID=UPI00263824B8|nr:hypothetical protein [uncultured Rhodospira sp.]